MDKKKAEQAKYLLYELEKVQEIKDTMEKEAQNWWSFFTPDKQSWKNDGLMMPEILREEFTKAVDRSIERLEKQIEEL
jgi:hypothetical protein